jgi:tRNA dimethylallyltransferase
MARPIPIIIGPTAVGKTDLSVTLAQALDAEIISADSRQIYRLLDIGTAKPDATQRQTVPHHLIDVVNPDEALNAARFAAMAWGCIHAIETRGRQPLIVGGSGLYIRALTDGLFSGPGADPHLRASLEVEADVVGGQALHRRLAQIDPTAAARIHPHDRVRMIRALEIYALTGQPISQWQRQWQRPTGRGTFVLIGLQREREDLRQRIATRTAAMLDLGLETEVNTSLARGFAPTLPALQSVGYAEMIAHLAGTLNLSQARELIERHTWRLAKRQMTWFRHIADIQWISLTDTPDFVALDMVQSILTQVWSTSAYASPALPHDQPTLPCTCPAVP